MFSSKKVLLSLLPLLLLVHATAAEEPALCKKIRSMYTGSQTITTDFEQSIFWTVREKTSRKKGSLVIAPDNKFNVNLSDEILVSDGTTFWQYSKKDRQVVIRNADDIDEVSLPANILSGFLNNYSFKEKEQKGKATVLEWIADSTRKSSHRNVILSVITKTGVVQSLSFTDENNNIHTYRFKNTVFNKSVPKKTFSFKVPADAHIVDNRS